VSLATACKAGHCTACGQQIWRTAVAARDNGAIHAGQEFLLWPMPASLYAVLETTTGHAPGVAFCRSCAPAPGELALEGFGATIRLEGAHERYAGWFREGRDVFYRAWLMDALSLEPAEIEAHMSQWQEDRRGQTEAFH